MTNRLFVTLGLAAALLLAATGCDLLGGEEDGGGDPEEGGWVAMTAVYAKTDSGGTPIQRIVLADFDNPSNYKVITDTSNHAYVQPRFSPDKTKLLFRDYTVQVEDAGEQFMVYDLEQDSWQRLPAVGRSGLWNAEGTGFYYRQNSPFVPPSVRYHRLGSKERKRIKDKAYAVGQKDRDSLIVFSNEKRGVPPGGPPGTYEPFYFMSSKGDYLAHISNPHLQFVYDQRGVAVNAAYNLSWNDERKLFAIATYNDSVYPGYKIAVTNLDGSYYREYTSGEYVDDHPRWGPNGKYILFDRREPLEYEFTDYQAMVLDLETGEVREFVKPEVIDGAIALRFPDY